MIMDREEESSDRLSLPTVAHISILDPPGGC